MRTDFSFHSHLVFTPPPFFDLNRTCLMISSLPGCDDDDDDTVRSWLQSIFATSQSLFFACLFAVLPYLGDCHRWRKWMIFFFFFFSPFANQLILLISFRFYCFFFHSCSSGKAKSSTQICLFVCRSVRSLCMNSSNNFVIIFTFYLFVCEILLLSTKSCYMAGFKTAAI